MRHFRPSGTDISIKRNLGNFLGNPVLSLTWTPMLSRISTFFMSLSMRTVTEWSIGGARRTSGSLFLPLLPMLPLPPLPLVDGAVADGEPTFGPLWCVRCLLCSLFLAPPRRRRAIAPPGVGLATSTHAPSRSEAVLCAADVAWERRDEVSKVERISATNSRVTGGRVLPGITPDATPSLDSLWSSPPLPLPLPLSWNF